MASFTLKPPSPFPVGTVVSVYAASDWPTIKQPPSGSPPGSAVTTGTVASDGTVTFSGLADATAYYASASVSGARHYVGLSTPIATALSGALASRPTATATNRYTDFFATDEDGGTLYRNLDGSNWTQIAPGATEASGTELAYAETSTSNATTSDTAVDWPTTALSITVPQSSRPVMLHLHCPQCSNDTATKGGVVTITDNANTVLNGAPVDSATANQIVPADVWYRIAAGAAGATYKARMQRRGSGGTFTIGALATRKPFLRAVTA